MSKVAIGVAVIAVGILGMLYFGERQHASSLLAELETARASTNELAARVAELQPPEAEREVSAQEVERLRTEQREAIRLRGEVTSLKQQVATAAATAKAAQMAANSAQARARGQQPGAPGQFGEPQHFSAQAAAALPPGDSLVVGGWPSGSNTVTYTFLTPTITEQGTNSLTVAAKMVEMSEELANKLKEAQGNPGEQFTLTPEQMNAMMAAWEKTPGVNIISTPRLTILSGSKGNMSIAGTRQSANGTSPSGSQQIQVAPVLSADGTQIQLDVDAKLTTPSEQAQP